MTNTCASTTNQQYQQNYIIEERLLFRFHSSLSKLYKIHTTQHNYKYVSVYLSTTSASFIYAELATVTIRIANPSIQNKYKYKFINMYGQQIDLFCTIKQLLAYNSLETVRNIGRGKFSIDLIICTKLQRQTCIDQAACYCFK